MGVTIDGVNLTAEYGLWPGMTRGGPLRFGAL